MTDKEVLEMFNGPALSREETDALMEEIDAHVTNFFMGDREKVGLWWESSNSSHGGLSPYDMVDCGRIEKLAQFVRNAVEANKYGPLGELK